MRHDRSNKKKATEPWNTKVANSKPPSNHHVRMWENLNSHRTTDYRRSSLEVWTGLNTHIRMNSHIWCWSPSFKVAIDWRRNGIYWQPEGNEMDTHPGIIKDTWSRRRHKHYWILWGAINVQSETEKIVWKLMLHIIACKCVKSDSLVKVVICWDQSPRNWLRILYKIGTNPRGWRRP